MPATHSTSVIAAAADIRVAVPPGRSETQNLELLDDPAEWSAFSRPAPGVEGRWESSVVFEGMHCAACALTIEDALLTVPGVASVQVSAGSHLRCRAG